MASLRLLQADVFAYSCWYMSYGRDRLCLYINNIVKGPAPLSVASSHWFVAHYCAKGSHFHNYYQFSPSFESDTIELT